MFREKNKLTPLEARKQMLILESELNRALVVKEAEELRGEVRDAVMQAQHVKSLISTAADLAGAFSSLRQAFAPKADNGTKRGWFSTFMSTARAGASIWQAFRGRGRGG